MQTLVSHEDRQATSMNNHAPEAPPAWLQPFEPLFRNRHLETIVGRFWTSPLDESKWPTAERLFTTEPEVRVLAHINRQASGSGRATVLAVHGLTASSQAPYMRNFARAALRAGFDVIRLNVRNCGGTEHLAPTLYHSGLTADLSSVVEQLAPAPLFLVGFSMGGNMALKLAGEWGRSHPRHVKAVCGVSVPIDLASCARHLGLRRNRIYERRLLRDLLRTVAKKQSLMPERFSSVDLHGIGSIWDFDEAVTAPAFGFRDAADYYAHASSASFLPAVRMPALVIQAKDDPFIPFEVFDLSAFSTNADLRLVATEFGGHVAFLARREPRFWAIEQAVRFFQSLL